MRSFSVENLKVEVHPDRRSAGGAAAQSVASRLRALLSRQPEVRITFASAASQDEFLEELSAAGGIDWSRVVAFQMDDYEGLPPTAPQSFMRHVQERLYDRVALGRVHAIDGMARDLDAECRRHAEAVSQAPLDLACLGIGENGHIAFNDPPVADFKDPRAVKIVALDLACRTQQLHEAGFASLDAVPRRGITLTIPTLLAAGVISCVAPGPRKAAAVRAALRDPVSTSCPATILRTHAACTLFLDDDSAKLL
jgi:glucosamine-6-phosphate deaminase